MKKSLMTACFVSLSSLGYALSWPSFSCLPIDEANFEVGLGYRQDELNWTIASPSGSPDVLSELSWEDIKIAQIAGIGKASYSCYVAKVLLDYGYIYDGENTDSDFDGDGRTKEYSRSIHDAGKGYVFDASAAIGYHWSVLCDQLVIEPLVGYSYNTQHLHLYNGKLIKATNPDNLGRIDGLDSSYRTNWYGPWLGLDLTYKPLCNWEFYAGYEYHFALYRAKGNWNLRSDLPHGFDHKANNGIGRVYNLGVRYIFCENITIGLIAYYQTWRTGEGSDSGLVVDTDDAGNSIAGHFSQPLNRVKWRSASLMMTLGYHY